MLQKAAIKSLNHHSIKLCKNYPVIELTLLKIKKIESEFIRMILTINSNMITIASRWDLAEKTCLQASSQVKLNPVLPLLSKFRRINNTKYFGTKRKVRI